jgi:hypothetical protein
MAFFAGSTVLMADGSRKNIENISYGDYIKDFQGNSRMVDGIRIQPMKSNRDYCLINESFLVPTPTVFATENYKFKCAGSYLFSDKENVYTIKRPLPYVCENNKIHLKWMWIDESYSITSLQIGDKLIKENNQLETVTSIRSVSPPEINSQNECYVFSAEGGTCWINGYLVTSRFSEKWDYNLMQEIQGTITITCNGPDQGLAKRIVNIDFSTNEDSVWDEELEAWVNYWKKR